MKSLKKLALFVEVLGGIAILISTDLKSDGVHEELKTD